MALPFILFPSAITNSLAVLLLPSVAKDQAEGRKGSIAASMSLSLRYSLYMGILCIGIGLMQGDFTVIWQKAVMICLECIGIG